MTRVLICGDRNWKDYDIIEKYIRTLPSGSVIINGRCRGVDNMARFLAHQLGYETMDFPADWDKYGRSAGPIRNGEMLKQGKPELVVAFHDDIENSKGTKDMVRQSRNRGIETIVIVPKSSMSVKGE